MINKQILFARITVLLWSLSDSEWLYIMSKCGSYLSVFRSLPEHFNNSNKNGGGSIWEGQEEPENTEEILKLIEEYKGIQLK